MDGTNAETDPPKGARKIATAAFLVAVAASPGCGTMANMKGQSVGLLGHREPTKPFGGVQRELRWFSSTPAPFNLVWAADLPLSVVGDFVTLPRAMRKQRAARSGEVQSFGDESVPSPEEGESPPR